MLPEKVLIRAGAVGLATLFWGVGLVVGCGHIGGVGDAAGGSGGGGGAGQGAGPVAGSGGSSGVAGSAGAAGDTTGGGGPDPCAGVLCSGHGSCKPNASNQPECACESGYHPVGLECVVDETCVGVECGYCAECQVVDGHAGCVCPPGFKLSGMDCEVDGDPCASVSCDPGMVCVPAHHCQIDPGCTPTCDCSNCGTCSMQDFVNAGAMVLYCGSGQQAPATMACALPCPSGMGCIPYQPPICWGMQGCMSL
jgi:hypothetical protein